MSHPAIPPPASAVLEALRWFPLVPRPSPARASLTQRLVEIQELVRAAPTAADRLTTEAVAWNKAALLASDQGLPDLARDLCWEHHRRYDGLPSFDDRTARLALEPLVNLARLHRRAGHTDEAVAVLAALRLAVDTRTDITVDGHPIRTGRIPAEAHQHRRLRSWMWSVHLAEGIRALTAAGRWAEARDHAQCHRGVGRRLLDGRQTAVIAHLSDGDAHAARDLIDTSDAHEPWERVIAAVLTCAVDFVGGQVDPTNLYTMAAQYIVLRLDKCHAAFLERLELSVLALVQDGREIS